MPDTHAKSTRRRIALWTPLPPLKTGIADYIAELLPHLVQHFDIEIFVDDDYQVEAGLRERYAIFSHRNYLTREKEHPFDLNVYQMGNNVYHLYMYHQALMNPGLVVLHDLSLSMVLYHYYVGIRNDLATFKAEFEYSEGVSAVIAFDRHYNAGNEQALMELFGSHPMLRRLVERNFALITHLNFATQKVSQLYSVRHVYTMYLGSPDPYGELDGLTPTSARETLGIPPDAFHVGIFGHLQATKQNDVSLRALARLKRRHPQVMMSFVGPLNTSAGYGEYITALIEQLGVKHHVKMTGYVSREQMLQYLLASDVIVNLRYPSFGAMSATLSRAIAAAKPIIITDLPEWDVFPEDFCWRVPAADREGMQLEQFLARLIEDPALIYRRGQNARDFYLREGTTQQAAVNLQGIVEDVIQNVPKELAPAEPPDRLQETNDLIFAAFSHWENMRAGGKHRHTLERVRRVPLLGSVFFAAYRLIQNLLSVRELRRADWSLNRALSEGVTRLQAQVEQLRESNEGVTRLQAQVEQLRESNEGVTRLQAQVEQLRESLVEIHEFPPLRVLENPFQGISEGEQNSLSLLSRHESDALRQDAYYIAFENVFRGGVEIIRARQERLLSSIAPLMPVTDKPVLDVGCGRGEFLTLLRERDVPSVGIETNTLLVQNLKDAGYDVHQGDAAEYLRTLQDESLAGITAFHVVEHFDHQYLIDFLRLAYAKVMPGGFVYFETPNPYCFESLSNFYTDPTHVRPIQPFQISFLLEYCRFNQVRLFFQEPVPARGSFSEERWMRQYQDYGAFAQK